MNAEISRCAYTGTIGGIAAAARPVRRYGIPVVRRKSPGKTAAAEMKKVGNGLRVVLQLGINK